MCKEDLKTNKLCDEQILAMILDGLGIAYNLIRKCAVYNNCQEGKNIAESMLILIKRLQDTPDEYKHLSRRIKAFLDLIKNKPCPSPKICAIVLSKLQELLTNVENADKILQELRELQM